MAIEEDNEKRFEQDIETYLLTEGGYAKGSQENYDKTRAIDMDQLLNFVQETQEKEWKRYVRNYGDDAPRKLFKRLNDEIESNGLLYVLRNGISDRGAKIKIAAFRPESTLNEKVIRDYQANRWTVTRQFAYSTQNHNTLDMALSLNGVPIVALELKNQIKGQSVDNAKKQFMYDRNPRELCFQFNKRFLVYFAIDLYEAWMTTKLSGDETSFLPFNQGSNGAGQVGGAGNPANPEGYATAYVWEKVLQKDTLMNILQRYMHLDVNSSPAKLIFPRFHQLDVVEKLIHHARLSGSSHNYLVQHSAGSGKSNSIAWLAYRLASLHNEDDDNVFTSTIIVTDRRVLDRQLQDTIASFDHTAGLVETIGKNKTSKDLRDAINDGKKIIITTLQKFPVIFEEIEDNKGKNFAVIVDEAHSSQTGNSAKKLKAALADTEQALREYAELEGELEDNEEDGQDKIVKELITHGKQPNLSFFAFTATPKEKTLEMFGTKQPDGKFRPFHVYSMRQAIEEGFILDVLANYMTFKTSFKISKNIPDNPELPASKGVQAIKRYESLHSFNLQQKTAVMVEHFKEITQNKIKGKAKAMVVTASRLHAVRYLQEFRNYIEKMGYTDMDVLVAFSGSLNIDEEEVTETKLNKTKDGRHISEDQLPEEFHGDNFNVLIVAEKYQTGFDEPLLHTMFVDKKLKNVKAVQTLSRLNRTCSGKKDTFILDFVNTAEEIQAAFAPYYEETSLDREINVNMIYDQKNKLRKYNVYNHQDVESIMKIYYKNGEQDEKALGQLTSALKPIIKRYSEMPEDQQYEFRVTLRNFNKWYSYIVQLTRMFDKELHSEYIFTTYLIRFIPKVTQESIDLTDKIKLEFYKLEKEFEGDISLNPDTVDGTLTNIIEVNTSPKPPEDDDLLENIIKKVNDRFEGLFTDGDRVIVEAIFKKTVRNNKKLQRYAKNNDAEVFEKSIYPEFFNKIAQELYAEQVSAFSKLFENKRFYDAVMEEVGREAYKDLRKDANPV